MYKGITIGTKSIAIPPFVKTSLFAGTAFMRYADATKGVADSLLWFGSPTVLIGGTAGPFAGNTWPIGNGTLFVRNGTLFVANGTLPNGNKVLPVDNRLRCTGMGAWRYHGKPAAVYRIAMSFPAVPFLTDNAADPEDNGAGLFSFVVVIVGNKTWAMHNSAVPNASNGLFGSTMLMSDGKAALPAYRKVLFAYGSVLPACIEAMSFSMADPLSYRRTVINVIPLLHQTGLLSAR